MIVDSKNIEFGYELISVIPYACHLNSVGQLDGTVSGNDTECFYFFSPNHKINKSARSWYNTSKAQYPNINIHKPYLDKSQFKIPDYKKYFANDKFKFSKESVIVCNRHNVEWSSRPINYFNLDCLKAIFELLQDKYQVIYINIDGKKDLYDNEKPIPLGDYDLLKQYPNVINIHELHAKHSGYSFNELQLMLFANCEKYITMNGGHAILAAYFGGENIVMSKYGEPQARELHPSINSFYRFYHEFSGQRVVHVKDENDLLKRIKLQWIDNEPVVNILVRTSERPNYFKNCIQSILDQTYKNVNIWCAIDTINDYTVPYPVYPIKVKKVKGILPIENRFEYGIPFPQNLFLNELHAKVKSGLIMYLDDDDRFNHNNALQNIVNEYKSGKDLIFWRVQSNKRIIPNDENFGKEPVCLDFSGIGLAFDSKYKSLATWEPYKRGDFRVAKRLFENILPYRITWINDILTRTQTGTNYGRKNDLNKNNSTMETMIKVEIIRDRYRGGKSKHKIGEIKELHEVVAKQLIRHGIAKIYVPKVEIKTNEKVQGLKQIVEKIKAEAPEKIQEVETPAEVIEKVKETKQKKAKKTKK